MAVVGHRDLNRLAAALRPWLENRLRGTAKVELPTPRPPPGGGSSETLVLEPVLSGDGQRRAERWVLRIQATANQIYQDPSVERQFRVMQALGQSGAVPVPAVLWFEPDPQVIGAPFFVMEHVAGDIPDSFHHSKGFFTEMPPARREAIWTEAIETMARLHRADIGPLSFLARPEFGSAGLEQEVAIWDDYLGWAGIPIRPVQRRARQWLADHLPSMSTGLAWGDARPGNMIFRDSACVAVIDWETASLAGAETDLGWWLFYDWLMSNGFGVSRLEGLPGPDETIRLWESFVGRKARDMAWHEVFATWRFSLISDRARMLMRMRGDVDPFAADAETPHARRLTMLIAQHE
jgi:aminoglycoside phosphotransferase (APT) family kinase protein